MSLARRQYNTRYRGGSQVVESTLVDTSCDWDEETIENAIAQARAIEEFDPDAAQQQLAQAETAKAKLEGRSRTNLEPYDPMRLYARVLRGYQGGITDADFDRIDYRRFFGYVRELQLMLEDEEKASKSTNNSHHTADTQSALSGIPEPEEYQGETIKLV